MVQNKCTIQFNLIQFNFNAPVHVPLGGTFISLECKSTRKLMFVVGEANGVPKIKTQYTIGASFILYERSPLYGGYKPVKVE